MFQLFRPTYSHHTASSSRGAWKAVLRSTLSVPKALRIPMPLTWGTYVFVLQSGLHLAQQYRVFACMGNDARASQYIVHTTTPPLETGQFGAISGWVILLFRRSRDSACCRSRPVLPPHTLPPHSRSRSSKRSN